MKSLFGTTWLGPEGITLSEIRQRKTNTIWSLLHVESKKTQKTKTRTKLTDTENRMVVARGRE